MEHVFRERLHNTNRTTYHYAMELAGTMWRRVRVTTSHHKRSVGVYSWYLNIYADSLPDNVQKLSVTYRPEILLPRFSKYM